MTTHHRRLIAGASLAALVAFGAVARAQEAQTQKPAPTPRVEQRFEVPAPPRPPGPQRPPTDAPRELQELREYRRPVLRLFQNYTLPAGEAAREVISVLSDVRIEGTVRGDVAVTIGNASLASTAVIDGSLVVVGGNVTVEKGARVDADIVVIGGTLEAPQDFSAGSQQVVIGTPAIARGLQSLSPWLIRGPLLGRLIVPDLPWVWTIVAITFLIGLVFNQLFARQVGACSDTLERRPVGAFLFGLLVLVLSGPVLMIVAATVIGLPFAIAAVAAASIIGKLAVTRTIGRGLVRETEPDNRAQAFRSFVIGSAAIILAYMVPILGLLTWAMIGVFAFGTATLTFAASLKRERPATPPATPVGPPSAPPAPPAPASFAAPGASAPSAAGLSSSFVAAEPSPYGGNAGEAFQAAPLPPAPPPPAPAPGVATPQPPAPPTGAGLAAYPRATFLDRVAAFALDAILVAIVNNILDVATHDGGPYMAMLLIYHVAFWAWKGTTLGGIICNVRMVRTTGEPPRFIDALVRGLSAIFSVAALGIGCLWMLNDPERQMWHDKIAGTVVVKLPRELVLA